MKEQIKFRFWDSELNKLLYRNPLAYDFNSSNIIPMQFIGLKDKNGNEIYEGDIIKTINGDDWGIIVRKNHCFEVTISETQSSLYMAEWIEKSEIIGNIYEHPNLI